MWSPGSQLSLLFELFAVEQRVGALVGAAMADCGLRPDQYAVYSVLFDEGPASPSEVARRVGMPVTTMSHYTRAMLERGHARRRQDPADRRSFRLELTAAGSAAHGRASRAFAEADSRFMAALTIRPAQARRTLEALAVAADVATADLTAAALDDQA
jgi:DNA-binding MarR family transcriptional regulator